MTALPRIGNIRGVAVVSLERFRSSRSRLKADDNFPSLRRTDARATIVLALAVPGQIRYSLIGLSSRSDWLHRKINNNYYVDSLMIS